MTTFTGTGGPDILTGGAGADTLTGLEGADTLAGLGGDDILIGSLASDRLDGGAGIDTAVYSSLYRAYNVAAGGGLGSVSGGPEGGDDALISVERIKFADGYFATGTTDTAAQVYRLYAAAFNRAPDQAGLNNWVNAIDRGQLTLVQVADGFVRSFEFPIPVIGSRPPPANAFVSMLYNNVLHRAPDAGGLQTWTDALFQNRASAAQVLVGFSESAENTAATTPAVQHGIWVTDASAAAVALLYDTVFGRLPDASGEANWTAALNSGTATLTQVAQGFVSSAEFQQRYAGLSNDLFVQLLYQNVLHRTGDLDGLTNWTNALSAGHSRGEVVVGFSESLEHIANTAPHIDDGVWFA